MADSIEKTESWEKKSIQQLLYEYVKEQKSRRRWNILFKIIFYGALIYIIYSLVSPGSPTDLQKPHVALIDLRGALFDDAENTADSIGASLHDAFEDSKTVGVILRINSPGGSAVQASYLFNEIRRLRSLYPKIKIYAVCTDLCASAAYYVAAGTDAIYANPSSLVGSIGVLFDGFGFVDTIHKLGVERRLYTAGDRKAFLDPFKPLSIQDKKSIQQILDIAHQQFINNVIKGRGKRLKQSPELFSGIIWTGVQAQQLGLIDGFASAGEVARNIFKNETIVDYTQKPNVIEQLSRRLGASFAGEIANRTGLGHLGLQAYLRN